VAAVSLGVILDEDVLLDLEPTSRIREAETDLNLVMTADGGTWSRSRARPRARR
jgi:ribonuclease PH